jgi:hypothetical protein
MSPGERRGGATQDGSASDSQREVPERAGEVNLRGAPKNHKMPRRYDDRRAPRQNPKAATNAPAGRQGPQLRPRVTGRGWRDGVSARVLNEVDEVAPPPGGHALGGGGAPLQQRREN